MADADLYEVLETLMPYGEWFESCIPHGFRWLRLVQTGKTHSGPH